MKKYDLIIFDLDGTLANTSKGILYCHKFANTAMGRRTPTKRELNGIIGGPLLTTYIERFNFSETDAKKAVDIYRAEYAKTGILQASKYKNIITCLKILKKNNFKLAVATLKAEYLAKILLKNLKMDKYFDYICGVDSNDTLTKPDLLNICMKNLNVSANKTLLIGDSIHDYNGAKNAIIDFLPVTYGFGFKNKEDLKDIKNIGIASTPMEILKFIN